MPSSAARVRARVRANFRPQWKGSIEGWTVNHIKRNRWRTMPAYDMAELLQEAWVQFLIVQERYPEVVDPPHFMSLYKRLFTNRVHDLAHERTRTRSFTYTELEDDDGPPATTSEELMVRASKLSPEMLETELRLLVEDAPAPLRQLLATLQTAPEDLLAFIKEEGSRGRVIFREGAKERLARLAGLAGFQQDPDGWRESGDEREARFEQLMNMARAWAGV